MCPSPKPLHSGKSLAGPLCPRHRSYHHATSSSHAGLTSSRTVLRMLSRRKRTYNTLTLRVRCKRHERHATGVSSRKATGGFAGTYRQPPRARPPKMSQFLRVLTPRLGQVASRSARLDRPGRRAPPLFPLFPLFPHSSPSTVRCFVPPY